MKLQQVVYAGDGQLSIDDVASRCLRQETLYKLPIFTEILTWKVKVCFYTAYFPFHWKHFTLHLLADLFIRTPTRRQLTADKHSSHAAIMRGDYSITFPPLSISRYSFIHLSELERCEENENDQTELPHSTMWTQLSTKFNQTADLSAVLNVHLTYIGKLWCCIVYLENTLLSEGQANKFNWYTLQSE